MTVDVDALIAESREWARKAAFVGRNVIRDLDRGIANTRRLADALESTLAELRQERGRLAVADRQFTRLKEQTGKADSELIDLRAALSRAKETIEKVRAEADAYGKQPDVMEPCGAVAQSLHFILTEYDKQKGADRGNQELHHND